MAKYFNTTGPCFPRMHYMLPPKDRLVGASLERYIRDELYWVLHAPRQTGKTTFLQSWMHEINAGDEAIACYVTIERCQGIPEPEKAIPAMIDAINSSAANFIAPEYVPERITGNPASLLTDMLSKWAAMVAPKKLIVLFDEVDVVEGAAMISFLRQLRDGFAGRGVGRFPSSIALVGMRDLRDYLVGSKDGIPLNPGSPFNIKHDSATLTNFTRSDIEKLVLQHTDATGQVFSDEAIERIWHYSSGQPWLVNALCDKVIYRVLTPESTERVTASHIDEAKEILILSRATHIDSLGQRLREERVRRVVEPMLIGSSDPDMGNSDDFQFCLDLGLVSFNQNRTPGIANAIYREVLARELSYGMQLAIPYPEYNWKNQDGSLNIDLLMEEFQTFWRWHSDAWEQKADYTEAFPHLLLMAFLQRITNGGGRIEREYAAGRGRVDVTVHFGGKINLIEIKLVHPGMGKERNLEMALKQIEGYAQTLNPDTCHLVIFDRRKEARSKSWDDRLSIQDATTSDGRSIKVVWC